MPERGGGTLPHVPLVLSAERERRRSPAPRAARRSAIPGPPSRAPPALLPSTPRLPPCAGGERPGATGDPSASRRQGARRASAPGTRRFAPRIASHARRAGVSGGVVGA